MLHYPIEEPLFSKWFHKELCALCSAKKVSSDYKKRWFFKEWTEWFFVTPKMVLL